MTNLPETSALQVVSSPEPAPSEVRRRAPRKNWTAEDTLRLVDAWGPLYKGANHGQLYPGDWKKVADAVNTNRDHQKKRTEIQCRNKLDTLKKRYKAEKAKTIEGNATSEWPLFSRMDNFVGPVANPAVQSEPVLSLPTPPLALPLPLLTSATAAAGKSNGDAGPGDGVEEVQAGGPDEEGGKKKEEVRDEGLTRLAMAVEKFVDIYEKVHSSREQEMELEIRRLEIARDLELQQTSQMLDAMVRLQRNRQDNQPGSSSA